MTKQTLAWLNQNVLIGQTARRGTAWHYRRSEQGPESNHFPFAIPVSEVQRRLFSWHAMELPVSVEVPASIETMSELNERGEPIRHARVNDRKAIATSDTFDVLGIFRSGYQPHQYQDWLLDNVATLLDGDLSISSAGLLRNRAVAWVEVSVPENVRTPEGVEFRPNLLATTSFDGSLATTFKRTITAVVCDNTHFAAMQERGQTVKFRHSKNSMTRIADARSALSIVYTMADDFAAEVAALTSQTVTDVEWSKILDQLVPNKTESKRTNAFAETKREQLTSLYREDARVAPWTGTAWGVLQAFSTWNEHVMPTKGRTIRAERNMLSALNGTAEAQSQLTLAALGLATPLKSAGVEPLGLVP